MERKFLCTHFNDYILSGNRLDTVRKGKKLFMNKDKLDQADNVIY